MTHPFLCSADEPCPHTEPSLADLELKRDQARLELKQAQYKAIEAEYQYHVAAGGNHDCKITGCHAWKVWRNLYGH
jgi:hypothetical protein